MIFEFIKGLMVEFFQTFKFLTDLQLHIELYCCSRDSSSPRPGSSCHCSWPLFTWSGTSVGSPHVNSACISIITSLMGKKRPVARKRKYAWNVWCYIRLLFCSHVKELQSIAKSSNFYFYDQYAISISTLLISIIAISIFQFPFDSEHMIMQFS